VLLTAEGKILDRLRCDTNSRFGDVRAEVLPEAARDGARIVMRWANLRILGAHPAYGCDFTVLHGDKFWKTGACFDSIREALSVPLCRVGVARDKFTVISPKLDNLDDLEIKSAKALRITYYPNRKWLDEAGPSKQLDIVDPKEVSRLLGAIKPEGEEQGRFGLTSTDPTVAFIMADGTATEWKLGRKMLVGVAERLYRPDNAIRWRFGRNLLNSSPGPMRIVEGGGNIGGTLHLASTAFFDEVEKAVSKAEGKPVDLSGEKRGEKNGGKADKSKN
jgi:hypothetical protein